MFLVRSEVEALAWQDASWNELELCVAFLHFLDRESEADLDTHLYQIMPWQSSDGRSVALIEPLT